MKSQSPDFMLDMAIQQGYVPKDCQLDGGLVMAHINESKDPCHGCNANRFKCKGRNKKEV